MKFSIILLFNVAVLTLVPDVPHAICGNQKPRAIGDSSISQWLSFEGTALIKISTEVPDAKMPVSANVFHSFPAWDVSVLSDTLLTGRNAISLICPARTLETVSICFNETFCTLLIRPGDSVEVRLTTTSGKPELEFRGKTQEIQNYYYDKASQFPVSVAQQMINNGIASDNWKEFKVSADSLYSAELKFWDGYRKERQLPQWFVRYESDAIRYRNAQIRLYLLNYRTALEGATGVIPEDYFDFMKTTPLRNEAALYDFDYLRFLNEYLKYLAKVGTKSFEREVEFELAMEKLGGEMGAFYTLYSISSYLANDPDKVLADLATLTFPVSVQYVADYLSERAKAKIDILRPGDLAPDFHLLSTDDSVFSLNQLRGKVVYLSFWFPGCKGCIHEFPFENALVEQFRGQPVAIVSICTRAKKRNWIMAVEKYELKTFNLFASGLWQTRVEESYDIDVYPHYVLIDHEGRIIQNFAPRPSQVSAQILQAMENLKGKK